MPTVRELREQRANVWSQMRDLRDAAAGRAFTAEEEQAWQRANDDIDRLGQEIDREETLERREREIDTILDDPAGDPEHRDDPRGRETDEQRQLRAAFVRYLRGGTAALTADEHRALQAQQPDLGGYLVPPEQFVRSLLQAVDDAVFIRARATKFTLTQAESLGVPSLDSDPADAEWTTELDTGSEDTSMRFGKRQLVPHPVAKRVKISNKLMRQAAIDPEQIVRARFAYKFGVTEEKAFLTGDGNEKPLGLFTASNDGIPTSRDTTVGTGTGAGAGLTADGLIDAKHELKAQYWNGARWLFYRHAMRDIRKLKDANDQYLWAPGLTGGVPNTVLELPYDVSEFVPYTVGDGEYVGLLGDLSFYWIADALDMAVQRLNELYAESNQTGFIFRRELDGMPVLAEAFVRLQLND